jgi:hypothetical protein
MLLEDCLILGLCDRTVPFDDSTLKDGKGKIRKHRGRGRGTKDL